MVCVSIFQALPSVVYLSYINVCALKGLSLGQSATLPQRTNLLVLAYRDRAGKVAQYTKEYG